MSIFFGTFHWSSHSFSPIIHLADYYEGGPHERIGKCHLNKRSPRRRGPETREAAVKGDVAFWGLVRSTEAGHERWGTGPPGHSAGSADALGELQVNYTMAQGHSVHKLRWTLVTIRKCLRLGVPSPAAHSPPLPAPSWMDSSLQIGSLLCWAFPSVPALWSLPH